MPITPLHLAAGGISTDLKDWVLPFGLTQIVIDLDVAATMYWNLPRPLHGTSHTLWGACFLAFIFVAWWRRGWWKPAMWGAISHVLLDSIVHTDVLPLWPFYKENPLFISGSIEIVSYLCLAGIGIQLLLLAICEIPWGTLSDSGGG